MGEAYISLISGFFGAIIGAISSLIVVWLQGRHWLRQQTWSNRERYYMDLLTSLSRLKLSLEDRSLYFEEPGSEYNASIPDDEKFAELSRIGGEALLCLREQIGPAEVFLSPSSMAALKELIREHWNVVEGSVCTADYIESAIEVVERAYTAVSNEAKQELAGA